jgi:MFS family permease
MATTTQAQVSLPGPANGTSQRSGARWWLLGLLLAINAANFADRTIVGALGQAIKADLRISDFQLGLLNGFAFAVFYSVLGLPVARLVERFNRVRIIAIPTGVWTVMAMLCGMAQSTRARGIQDLAPPRSRASAAFVAAFVSGMVGSGLGPAVSGLLSDAFVRTAFAGDFADACPSGLPPAGASAALELACMQASADGAIHWLAVICLALPCTALLFLMAGRSFPRELYRAGA